MIKYFIFDSTGYVFRKTRKDQEPLMKNKIIICILVLAAVAMILGVGALAFAAPGTQSDPFVTLSYLTGVFKPMLMAEVETAGQELSQDIDARIAALEAQQQLDQGSATAAPNAADRFAVVTLSRGQLLTCSVGTEIMLRIGSATANGSAPALVDYTDGDTLAAGAALATNHMYLVTIEGNGVRASADTVRVLVRGTYRIG